MRRVLLILSPLLLILTVFLSRQPGKLPADTLLLQEYVHPAYFHLLSTEQSEIWYYPEDVKKEGVVRNYFLNAARSGHYGGISVQVLGDGSICLDGKNDGEGFSIRCSPDTVSLGNGSYYLGTTEESPAYEQGYLYIEGWKKDADGTKKKLLAIDEAGRHEFRADSAEYDTYWYGLVIPAGFLADHLVIPPLLRRTDGMDADEGFLETDSLLAAAMYPDTKKGLSSFAMLHVDREALMGAEEDDMRIFLNNLKYEYGRKYGCKWVSFVFPDGTGIEWDPLSPGECVYGEVDAFGKVYHRYGSGPWQTIFQ